MTGLQRDSRAWVGPACAVGAAVLYGTSWVATGIGLDGFSPYSLAAWRSLVTVALLVPVVAWLTSGLRNGLPASPPAASSRGRLLRLFVLGLLGGAAFGIGMNVSVMLTGAAITAFIAGAYPVLAAAGAPLVLGEPIRLPAVAGLVAAFAGTLLIASFDTAGIRLDGVLVAGVTAVAVALFLLLSRRWQHRWALRPTQVTLSNFTLLGVAGLLVAVAAGDPLVRPSAPLNAWLAVLWLGLFAGAVATVLLMESYRRLPTSEGSAYLMLNPLTAAILAVPILGESLSPVQLVGAALILCGIGLATGTFAVIARAIGRDRRRAEPT